MNLLELFETNQITIYEIYDIYKSNIEKYNDTFNPLVTIEDQVFLKEYIDREAIERKNMILQGLPVVVKDSIMTKGIKTTCGSKEFKDYIPQIDSPVVKEIKKSGGLVSGKSNIPEYTLDVQTYNELFGITKNPYNPDLTAGGSSGGSAVAIRLGMTDLALGSDLAGSLRIPASYCGIKSMKPTFGRVSNSGHIPPGPDRSFSGFEITIGPMSSSVNGLELLMRCLTNKPVDGFPTLPLKPLPQSDTSTFKLKISTQLENRSTSHEVEKGMRDFISRLDNTVIEYELTEPEFEFDQIYKAHNTFYKLLMQSNEEDPDLRSPTPPQIAKAIEIRNIYSQKLEEFIGKNNAWILPVARIQPYQHNLDHNSFKIKDQIVDYWSATINYTVPFSQLGSPVIVIPVGMIDNVPFGIQIIGHRWNDEKLLSIAKYLEDIFDKYVDSPNIV